MTEIGDALSMQLKALKASVLGAMKENLHSKHNMCMHNERRV